MERNEAPPEIVAMADARAAARRDRDWASADRLKAEIEAAGWKVVDAATLYSLERAAPADVAEGGVVRYGSSQSVPSRLEEPPVGTATVVVVADGGLDAVRRTVRALVDASPDGTQLVIVAGPTSAVEADALSALEQADPGAPGVMTEVVWTAVPFGYAAALNAGIRRAVAPVVVILRSGVEPRGDLVGGIVRALEDPGAAVAGPVGLVTTDLRRYEEAGPDATALDAIAGTALGFRRADYVARGPLDEHFTVPDHLDAWWSLVLRDVDEEAAPGDDPRRAVRVDGVTIDGQAGDETDGADAGSRDRAARKAFYRYLKSFATRRDLLAGPAGDEVRARLRRLVGPGLATPDERP